MPTSPHPVARLPEEWQASLAERGERAYRAGQIFRWIHARGVLDPQAMTDLPKALRASLAEDGLAPPLTVEREHRSEDGTRKLLAVMPDGQAVETVLLPSGSRAAKDDADAAAALDDDDGDNDDDEDAGEGAAPAREKLVRVTQCISTQVGCAMGCVFCASGVAGLKRDMSAAEIVGQVLVGRSMLPPGQKLSHVVFMGMGEPLHNYDATARAIRLMTHPEGLGLSPRRLTMSTSGLVPEIDRLGQDFDGKVGLAISLHNADDAKRSALMPINKRYPLKALMAAVRRYPLPPHRRITIEYTLVRGQNDSLEDARRLAGLLRGLPLTVNLIPMNPIEHSALGPPPLEQVHAFQELLLTRGYRCFIRRRRGDDVSAACGQLVLLGAKPTASFDKRQPRGDDDPAP